MKTNKKVPIAILSFFMVAFLIQVVLKLSGVFIFEKALDWQIFGIIDNNLWFSIPYYSLFVLLPIYCLSFTLTTKPYSNKWYHYVIIVVASVSVTVFKLLCKFDVRTTLLIDILVDLVIYIGVPLLIYFTSSKSNRLFEVLNITNIIVVIASQILIYFAYLGLNYWSLLLNSFIPTSQIFLYASSALLVQMEVYAGLVMLMLSINILIERFKKEDSMVRPINVASDKAKAEELKKIQDKNTKK